MRRHLAAGVLMAALVSGCGPSLPDIRYFTLQSPALPAGSLAVGKPIGGTLEVRSMQGEGFLSTVRNIVHRPGLSDAQVSYYEAYQWEDWPGKLVGAALRRCLATSGLFREVVSPDAQALPDYSLSGDMGALEVWTGVDEQGPFQTRLEVDMTLVDVRSTREIRFSRTYDLITPVAGDQIDQITAGFNALVQNLCQRLATDISVAVRRR